MNLLKQLFFIFLLLVVTITESKADSTGKLSPWLRSLVNQQSRELRKAPPSGEHAAADPQVCAFIRISSDADEVLARHHSTSLTHAGNIHIANIPLSQLSSLAQEEKVLEIEASPSGHILLDSMSTHLNALPVYAGTSLPQAFTGKDVVVGIMDIGFDLTHPNFYSRDLSEYRIKALWDMLSLDTIGSSFPVGRDYVGQEALLALQHSRDANDLTHGTYTLGVAAGSGYDSPYRGMAPESDICLVANAVSNNKSYIAPEDYYKYTFATDALGFKYIFDYATSVGKPCVISFSEGSSQDFWGYDKLYYEMLDSLVGPGRILVAAAGNKGHERTWMHKERGLESKGTFLLGWKAHQTTLKSADDFLLRAVFYQSDHNDTLFVSSRQVLESPDSIYRQLCPPIDSLVIEAYPSCYIPKEVCYDVTFHAKGMIGDRIPLSLELIGSDADVELWQSSYYLVKNDRNPLLDGAEASHNIHSPSSAPCVISVGATTYRDSVINSKGESRVYIDGERGMRSGLSSTGPTMDGRIKPDVMAPGVNIISSYGSFYLATNPGASDASGNVAYYNFNGRTYSWNCNSGTSSSSPAAAGVIALWLQARPDLTPKDVMDIIAQTSKHNDPSLSYPNNLYGYGEIDAYRGLLYLLGIDGIEEISHRQLPLRMSFTSSERYQILFPEPTPREMRLSLFNLSGSCIMRTSIPAGVSSYSSSLPNLSKGTVYVIQLDGYLPYSGSMLYRHR